MSDCPHATPLGQSNSCALGLYGGRPSQGTCQQCMALGQNNEDFARDLFARADRSHPANRPRISGCCDRADQA